MLKSSLLEILRTFTKQELIKFEDFVRSPYFNKKENVLKLFLELKKYAPSFESENLEKEKVWSRLFSGQKYNYGIMKNLIHDLGKLCESFLSEEVYKTNEMQRTMDFFNSVLHRNIPNIFLNKYESAVKTFNKNYESGKYDFTGDYFDMRRDYYELKAEFLQFNSRVSKKEELIKTPEFLIFGFLLKCFKTFHMIILDNLDFNTPVKNNIAYLFLKDLDDSSALKNILNYAKEHSPKNHPVLLCYYSMYKALSCNDSIEYFEEFRNNLSRHSGLFSKNELRELYLSLLTSFGNRKFTTNDFYTEYFKILQLGFENKVILKRDGTIAPENFVSIVNVTCSNKEIKFAEEFIGSYKDKLPPEFRESLYNYAMAHLNFYKDNFEKSLEFIAMFQTRDIMLKFFIRNLQISIYYELNDRISFDYSIDSFRHFIKKNNLSNESRVIVHTKYCEYVTRLFKLREKTDHFELSKLKKEITEVKATNKKWLLKKIEELEKVKS